MDQTYFTPLSLSMLLKEKEVKQESMFYWQTNHLACWQPNGVEHEIVGKNGHHGYNKGYTYLSAFILSELPDVFRQVFGASGRAIIGQEENYSDARFTYFCSEYFKDPKTAWQNLENTIKSL